MQDLDLLAACEALCVGGALLLLPCAVIDAVFDADLVPLLAQGMLLALAALLAGFVIKRIWS